MSSSTGRTIFQFICLFIVLLTSTTISGVLSARDLGGRQRLFDSTNEGTGDGAATNCRCSEEETFANVLRSGSFKSPGYPLQYCDLLNCKWNIEPAADSFVSATLTRFETESKYDVLEVYQSAWNGSQLLTAKQAVLSGPYDPHKMERHFFSSLGGGLLFRFVSDSSDHAHPGFLITFQRHPKTNRLSAPCPLPFHTATSQPQQLPTLAAHFRTDSSCIFVINSTEAVKLTVKRFVVSMLNVVILETENFQASGPHGSNVNALERIESSPPQMPVVVTSRTGSLTVLINSVNAFHRMFSQSLGAGNLYDIQFEQTTSVCACFPSTLVVSRDPARPQALVSPGYPQEYCDNHKCAARISLEAPMFDTGDFVEVLRIRFNSFQTESELDWIALKALTKKDQAEEEQDLLMLSGEAKSLRYFTLNSPQFALNFSTDHSIVDRGFNLSLEASRKHKDCICPGAPLKFLDGYKHYEQNAFDAHKCTFMDCFWQIQPPTQPGLRRLLFQLNHTMADPTEFVEACQGSFGERNPMCYRFESDSFTDPLLGGRKLEFLSVQPMGPPATGPSQPVTIWYHREWPDSEEQEMEMPDTQREINFSYEWREACQCGAQPVLQATTEQWQSLTSPDHPYSYCRSMQCRWRLQAPEGHHLVLNISEFNTEADQDFLFLFDGNDTTREHMEMLTGLNMYKNPVRNTGPVLTLYFTTDSSIQFSGFVVWFKAEPNSSPEQLTKTDESAESGGGGGFPRALLFTLFLLLALSGLLFLLVRSSSTNAHGSIGGPWRAPSWLWLGSGGTNDGLHGFVEGRVRFIRNWTNTGGRPTPTADNVSTGTGAETPTGSDAFSVTNPLFSFRTPNFL